jgi:hypothetical protein
MWETSIVTHQEVYISSFRFGFCFILWRISFSKKIKICFIIKPTLDMCYYFTHSILVIHLKHLTENILRLYLHNNKISGGKWKVSKCAKFLFNKQISSYLIMCLNNKWQIFRKIIFFFGNYFWNVGNCDFFPLRQQVNVIVCKLHKD